MKLTEKKEVYEMVKVHFLEAQEQLIDTTDYWTVDAEKSECAKPLRNCKAWVWETPDYYILQSYNTLVACIEKNSNICYDALRITWGYTSTSAMHICKFMNDYGKAAYGCELHLTASKD